MFYDYYGDFSYADKWVLGALDGTNVAELKLRIQRLLFYLELLQSGCEGGGRCLRFAPDVDGEVRIRAGSHGAAASAGTMVPVRITAADIYDLEGEVVGAQEMVDAVRHS